MKEESILKMKNFLLQVITLKEDIRNTLGADLLKKGSQVLYWEQTHATAEQKINLTWPKS